MALGLNGKQTFILGQIGTRYEIAVYRGIPVPD